jgi:penicillin-binding protein 1A
VVFPDGHSELPKRWKVKRTKAFDDGVTYEATKILKDNIQGGTGTKAQFGCPAGGKTGTTDHNTDAWFSGFTPRLATAVWVGYPTGGVYMNSQFFGGPVDGGTFPALIWGTYMKQAVGKYCGDFKKPTQPFVSQPFFGHYATTGLKRSGTPTPGPGLTTTPGVAPTPAATAAPGATATPQGFDPNLYETPPQGEPGTGGAPAPTATPPG